MTVKKNCVEEPELHLVYFILGWGHTTIYRTAVVLLSANNFHTLFCPFLIFLSPLVAVWRTDRELATLDRGLKAATRILETHQGFGHNGAHNVTCHIMLQHLLADPV